MIVGLGRSLQRDAQELAEARRKGIGKDRVAFDHPGVAVGRCLAGPASIDERHRHPALGEMQRDRHPDDAGPKHDDVRTRHAL